MHPIKRIIKEGRAHVLWLVHTFLVGFLLWGFVCDGGESPEPGRAQEQAGSAELTNDHPEVSLAVPADAVQSAPPVLELHFPRVVNPNKIAFEVFVFLTYRPNGGTEAEPARILLGSGSLYPADQPGGLRLRASGAWRKVKGAKGSDVRLVLEMKRIHPAKPWTQVAVTVAAPEWREEN